ncbi:hypothetical protein POM88_048007 [Heracleum sosnowskyi]|uniref:F-box associated beta-propeller type 3 domain-containing protein n=1 Tax=Heracleum sosnowskyi TaxID=360622 RepID=A0AAD8LZ91_9APIA|nr:hypothetical protein POM88_048007 [Heracleum sosnowskyi]
MLETAIWNPATSRCLEITPLHVVTGNNILLGFGFDSVANDFKVVCASLIEGQPSTVDVYSCKAACWKKIAPSNILYSGINIFKRPRPTIIDGSPYWLSQKYEDGIKTLVVISFDIRNEVFRSLPSISYNIKFKNTHVLSNFRDSVAIMVYELGTYSDETIDVYMFNQRCSVWNKISIETFMVPQTTIDVLHIKLCFRNGDILCGNLDGRRLYRVNPKTRTIKILEEGKSEEYISNCCNYSESLVFIEGMKPIYGKRDEDIPPPASRGNLLLGFGFDSVANDFKVMCGSLIEKQPLAVDVYSCKAARWKKTAPSNILYSGCINNQMEPIIVNGSPFWLDTENQDTEISLVVISFDVHHEVFSLLPSFCVEYSESRRSDLMKFRDSLAIMVHDRCTYFVEPIDVYIFNQRCSDWNKISIGPFICKEPNIELNKIYVGTVMEAETTIKLYELIPCSRDGDILFVNCHSCRLYGVNPETHTIKILKEVSSEEHIYNCFNYSESLSFIEGMKPVNEKRDEGRFKFLLGEELELARSYEYI